MAEPELVQDNLGRELEGDAVGIYIEILNRIFSSMLGPCVNCAAPCHYRVKKVLMLIPRLEFWVRPNIHEDTLLYKLGIAGPA